MKTALGEVDLPLFVPAEDEEGFCGGLRARRHTMDQATDCVEKTVIISFYGDTDGRGEANCEYCHAVESCTYKTRSAYNA